MPDQPRRLITRPELCAELRVSDSTLRRMERQDGFPREVFGPRTIRDHLYYQGR